MIDRFKAACARAWAWCGRQYRKLVAFLLTLLVGIGVVSYAEQRGIEWDHPTQRTDGTALSVDDIKETRLYCDGSLTEVIPAPASDVTHDFGIGEHTCHATTVDLFDQESAPSASVTFTVLPAKPEPPTIRLQ